MLNALEPSIFFLQRLINPFIKDICTKSKWRVVILTGFMAMLAQQVIGSTNDGDCEQLCMYTPASYSVR